MSYSVVRDGDTTFEPFNSTRWSPSVTHVAPVLVHVSVDDPPGWIVVGLAVSVTLSVEPLGGLSSSSSYGRMLAAAVGWLAVMFDCAGAVGDVPWHAVRPITVDHKTSNRVRFIPQPSLLGVQWFMNDRPRPGRCARGRSLRSLEVAHQ
jgi:hypothetical protein